MQQRFFSPPRPHYSVVVFILILSLGMFLRFYHIEKNMSFGWDQARDAWKVRDIVQKGQIVLDGPKTGIGNFNLGPLWFYYLAPFYHFMNLDPSAANIANFWINIFNFFVIFYVTKKIFSDNFALFVLLIYATSRYFIEITRTPWNISPVPGVSLLIFYAIWQIYQKKYIWIPWLVFLIGLFSHLHFSFVFFLVIIPLSFIFISEKKKVCIRLCLSAPFFLVWFVPHVVYGFQSQWRNSALFKIFFKEYVMGGVHPRFLISRLNDTFILFDRILLWPSVHQLVRFVIPLVFVSIVWLYEKDHQKRLQAYLMMLWFVVPWLTYSLYSGATSDYYVLIHGTLILYIIGYLQQRLYKLHPKLLLTSLIIIWSVFILHNNRKELILGRNVGLALQKEEVREAIRMNRKIEYHEGVIKSYLWHVYEEDGITF